MDLKVRLKSTDCSLCAVCMSGTLSDKERLAESSPIWVDQFHRKASGTRMLMIFVICIAFFHFCNNEAFSKLPPDEFRSSTLTNPAISLKQYQSHSLLDFLKHPCKQLHEFAQALSTISEKVVWAINDDRVLRLSCQWKGSSLEIGDVSVKCKYWFRHKRLDHASSISWNDNVDEVALMMTILIVMRDTNYDDTDYHL